MVKLPVENEANVNLESAGRKPLEHAIVTGNIEIVCFLVGKEFKIQRLELY